MTKSTQAYYVTLDEADALRVEAVRRSMPVVPSKTAAVRMLITLGLDAYEREMKEAKSSPQK